MTDPFRVSRLDAAHRQLNLAIRLLFASADPVAIHTLVGAATTILHNASPEHDNGLAPTEFYRMTHKAQNLFKQAGMDLEAMFELDPKDSESLAFWAVMNASELGPLSLEEQLYQQWYIASHLLRGEEHETLLSSALQTFGDLSAKSRREQIQAGARGLAELDASGPSDSTHWKSQGDYQ
ncbi:MULTISPECIES: hypothetical protein [unclassified Pseudomonas]|uniref:hypothetical protein n=1 Tax=unclassified Pseudomonas TaxID=196821 RepID=UPI002AC9AF2D|nr:MULTISPECIES: hypothetical protein [unclassified Pseudomonas]MEB0042905.1 hypothetical protein [Pseudomonas sp. MH10]MEB0120367.1 hypothetical protein [Pseudomonas sp. CCI1.2]WPX65576.1 hypothetical protein RHM59_08015 [Pseudomonas sp. MH10]